MESNRSPTDKASNLEASRSGEPKINGAKLPGQDVGDEELTNLNLVDPIPGVEAAGRANGESPPPKRRSISTNPLALVVVGFLLSTIPGGLLTFYYGSLQQEIAARRSFSDEVNKIRLPKLGEVWERLDEDEFTINRLLRTSEVPYADPGSKDKIVEEIRKLIGEDKALVSKHRFWLGEGLFRKTSDYLDMSIDYAVKKITAPPGTDLSELIRKRDNAKEDILKVRQMFLEGEPSPQAESTNF